MAGGHYHSGKPTDPHEWFLAMRHVFVILLLPVAAIAQGTKADYERSGKLYELFGGKVYGERLEPRWSEDGKQVGYVLNKPDGKREYVLIDIMKGTKELVKEDKLPPVGKKKKRERDSEDFPLENPENSADREELSDAESKAFPQPELTAFQRQINGVLSPDGKWRISIENDNIVLRTADLKEETKLTSDGKPRDRFDRIIWSPDSRKFIAMKTRAGGDRKVTLVESSPRDQLQPKTSTYDYLKPGDPIPLTKPHLFDVATKKEIPVADDLLSNPWSINDEHWSGDSKRFYFSYNQRGHTVMRVLAIEAESGIVSKIVNEECKTFFDYNHKYFLRYLDASDELIWMSERDGWNHLYRYDLKTGKVKNAITNGEWVVRRVLNVNVEKSEITFEVLGVHANQDPYHSHFARVNFDGTGLVILTDGDGTHTRPQFSPDGKHYVVSYSRVDLPPVTELRRTADGKKVLEMERADISALEKTGWKPPERFVSKSRDGKSDIHGIIHRQTHFDPKKKYQVIEYIYAGPHGFHVPKSFRPVHFPMPMAELGFILVQIDGMGTNWRSKAFHDICWKNLGDSGFPDRIKWIRAAAEKHPEMDLSKGVGIYGGSAGGQSSTRAVLAHPDFYKVAVSDCGCHDNRMDKIWWNELWMSWPIGKHYAEQSNTNPEMVKQFQGKLMLVVGELDRNVDPSSTMQVANALIKANKDFDLLVVPGGGHGACESPYGQRRRADFFVRHLMGTEPRTR